MKLLIDHDIVLMRGLCICADQSYYNQIRAVDNILIDRILDRFPNHDYQLFLSGGSKFRKEIDPNYKAHRPPKPQYWLDGKKYSVKYWGAIIQDGWEADDLLGVNHNEDTIICSTDKDLKTIPGWNYNFVKDELTYISEDEAAYNLWIQIIMGDSVDGIKGIKGVGKVKAEKLLHGKNVSNFREIVENKYLEVYGSDGLREFDKNARLCFIKRGSLDSEYFNYYK